MKAKEFERAGRKIFGKRWKVPMASALDCNPVTIWRYVTEQTEILKTVVLAVRYLLSKRKNTRFVQR